MDNNMVDFHKSWMNIHGGFSAEYRRGVGLYGGVGWQVCALWVILLVCCPVTTFSQEMFSFGPFDRAARYEFALFPPATVADGVLKLIPTFANNQSARAMLRTSFMLWDKPLEESSNLTTKAGKWVASFNTSFEVVVSQIDGITSGEGLAFIVTPDLELPIAVMDDIDPQDNSKWHVGLDINSVRSRVTRLLTIPLFTSGTVWLQYDGNAEILKIWVVASPVHAQDPPAHPLFPVLSTRLNLSDTVSQKSFFGFAASSGSDAIEMYSLNGACPWRNTPWWLMTGPRRRKRY
ncbi:hypothetical protein CRG98_018812 [Punica granatum]|uniref:Legume lectin domain-containing protein n=1 Tax=Punica granatum TaxID=22663 RepID=A0A2I0JYC6_PUNGR|nr:hypothetical protein CRG98_018812 [Punica granatum]